MPQPKEICLEDLDLSPQDERYLRCVALPGGEPGLALDREGVVRWMPDDERVAHGLWVSADERLVLLRGPAAGPIAVERAGRSLEAPADKPVILLDGDLLRINGRRLQVHVHGTSEAIYAPEPLTGSALGRVARAAATALALGAAVGAGGAVDARPLGDGASAPIEVRRRPPKPAPRRRPVDCVIKSMQVTKQGPVMVQASCPNGESILPGLYGYIIDAKTGGRLKDGGVVVKTAAKGKVVCEAAQLKKPVKATTLRFHVRW